MEEYCVENDMRAPKGSSHPKSRVSPKSHAYAVAAELGAACKATLALLHSRPVLYKVAAPCFMEEATEVPNSEVSAGILPPEWDGPRKPGSSFLGFTIQCFL